MISKSKQKFLHIPAIALVLLLVLISYPYGSQASAPVVATGGTITTSGENTIHTFTSSGTFTVTSGYGAVSYLVVAGGGGGGRTSNTTRNRSSGGGGAGGMRTGSLAVSPASYTITIGSGGAGSTDVNSKGANGSNSIFGSVTATSGGGGGSSTVEEGAAGGSGGGGGGGGGDVGGAGTSGQGNNGGAGCSACASSTEGGGGGGGAGAVGGAGTSIAGGNGGAGSASSISGSSVTYAGGGGGGTYGSSGAGSGGAGGGGAGGNPNNNGTDGTVNTGGGGGGSGGSNGASGNGGAGGSGIVIISYATAGKITLTGNVNLLSTLNVGGALTKGVGSFVIDHPLDPANKILAHSFVESPDAKNIYDGTAKLDRNGEVEIKLPSYFMALNKDFRYQFFALNEAMPNLYIRKEIEDNKFTISGGKSGGRISWQVTGIRHDPYILANPIIVEVKKGPGQLVDKGECLFEPLCQ